jgi:hypothetical protein
VSGDVEEVRGNREVPLSEILVARGDLSGAGAEANIGEEGGSWGKPGFPHATEAKPREVVA